MKFMIGFDLANGYEDQIVVEGETIEQVRERAIEEVEKRGGTNPWSEELKP